jgi:phosphoglycolate phosphatase
MALVMFDLDGTLLDTASEIADATNRTLRDYRLPLVSEVQVRDWIGHGTGWLMRTAWTSVAGEPSSNEWDQVMTCFIGHYFDCAGSSSRPYSGVVPALAELQRLGIKRAVVTNKESRFTQRILERHGMAGSFDIVISGDTYPVKKPDPAVIYNCLSALGMHAGESLFVGDSSIDVATAKAAGVICWAVPYGYNMGESIESAHPDRIISTLEAVPSFFKGMT